MRLCNFRSSACAVNAGGWAEAGNAHGSKTGGREIQCGVDACPHRFRHHFSHTWLDRGGPEGDLMELNGWASPQLLRRYGASARARHTYDRIMTDT
jgi:integrase